MPILVFVYVHGHHPHCDHPDHSRGIWATDVSSLALPLPSQFQLRVCPSLADKRAAGPSASSADDGDEHGGRGGGLPEAKRVKKSDPFEGPHEDSDLFLGKVGQEEGGEKMVGLLNKFSIVDEHFLLVTEGMSLSKLLCGGTRTSFDEAKDLLKGGLGAESQSYGKTLVSCTKGVLLGCIRPTISK
jgi:hypothetical protein